MREIARDAENKKFVCVCVCERERERERKRARARGAENKQLVLYI